MIPGWGTKILHAAHGKKTHQKKKKVHQRTQKSEKAANGMEKILEHHICGKISRISKEFPQLSNSKNKSN